MQAASVEHLLGKGTDHVLVFLLKKPCPAVSMVFSSVTHRGPGENYQTWVPGLFMVIKAESSATRAQELGAFFEESQILLKQLKPVAKCKCLN